MLFSSDLFVMEMIALVLRPSIAKPDFIEFFKAASLVFIKFHRMSFNQDKVCSLLCSWIISKFRYELLEGSHKVITSMLIIFTLSCIIPFSLAFFGIMKFKFHFI